MSNLSKAQALLDKANKTKKEVEDKEALLPQPDELPEPEGILFDSDFIDDDERDMYDDPKPSRLVYDDPKVINRMVEIGCLNKRCRNYKGFLADNPAKKKDKVYQVDVAWYRALRGIPKTHCRYCKKGATPVSLGWWTKDQARAVIADLKEKNDARAL